MCKIIVHVRIGCMVHVRIGCIVHVRIGCMVHVRIGRIVHVRIGCIVYSVQSAMHKTEGGPIYSPLNISRVVNL